MMDEHLHHISGSSKLRRCAAALSLLATVAFCLTGCGGKKPQVEGTAAGASKPSLEVANSLADANAPDPCRLILLPVAGDGRLDKLIARAQLQVRAGGPTLNAALEQLGWLFVSKARTTFDPGFYKLAEQAAFCLEEKSPHCAEALLLRGHVLDNLHRFKEAEALARELVARRGLSFDYGLLGDTLMETGRLDEAVAAYQKMADEKPDLQAYTRAAHIRWLKGDLAGAMEAMQMAVQATTPHDPETAAWVYTRMALYQLQAGNLRQGLSYCASALEFQPDYPPALLARGRLLLATGENEAAIKSLRQAAALNPLPEYQWTLVEALRAAGQGDAALERQLKEHGAAADPRTFALYLASERQEPAVAVRLAQAELQVRGDVFTHDTLAWSWAAAGKYQEAGNQMKQALAAGTQDARLFYHAGVIEEKLGRNGEALRMLRQADRLRQTLLPSERTQLAGHLLALRKSETD